MTSDFDRYKNKYFSVLGDSVSTFEGCSIPREAAFYDTGNKLASEVITVSDTWWGCVIERLSGKLLVNNSWSGSTVCCSSLCEVESYGCSDWRTSSLDRNGVRPDVIIVFMGLNDWTCGYRPGNAECCECDDCEVFFVAYRIMLKKLRQNYPEAEIWCITLPYVGSDSVYPDFLRGYGKFNIEEYCDTIRSCAQKSGCRLIDLYDSRCSYDTTDGIHPNKKGMEEIANCVLASIGCRLLEK